MIVLQLILFCTLFTLMVKIGVGKEFDAEKMLPGICNIDYMISHYMGNGFTRTMTLGYGDKCCDCHYKLTGKCPIRPNIGMK